MTTADLKNLLNLKYNQRKRDLTRSIIRSGVIGIHQTEDNLKLISNYQHQINKYGLCNWYSDQKALWNLFQDNNSKFETIPFSHIDWNFHSDSHVWMGKGKKKENNIVYRQYYQYCLSK